MRLSDFIGRNALTQPITMTSTGSLMDTFLPKVEPRYYLQWAKGWLTLRALITVAEAQAMARGEAVGLSGLEMLMNGSWVALPQTNERLGLQTYLTGQYAESDEPPAQDTGERESA